MPAAKVAITMDDGLLASVDQLVSENFYPNRSKAIQDAVKDKLERLTRTRLARECAKLDKSFEKSLADEGLQVDFEQWPEY